MPDITLPGGAKVPVPQWATAGFGVLAIVAIGFGVYRYFYPVEPELINVKQANAQLALEVAHYSQHIADPPVATLDDPRGFVSLRMFSDNCLLVSRRAGAMSTTRLLIDDASRPRATVWASLVPALEAQGRCLNPHPGRFQTSTGQRLDQCWVEVVRTFDDSCTHTQAFNTCTRTWATNPDGSPQVRWTRCVH